MLDQCFNHKIRLLTTNLLTPVPALAPSKFEVGPVIRRCSIQTFGATYTDLDRPLGLQVVEAPRISSQLAHESGKVVSQTHRPPLPRRRYSWYLFLLEAEWHN